jgi:thiamine-monophosphate kinase
MSASEEERFIAEHFERLSAKLPGAFALKDDCAELVPAPGQAFIVKTDPIIEGLHFLPDDDPADVAYKAVAVNVSDLAAKAARPFAYLLAIGLPGRPDANRMVRFTRGLEEAQSAFGLTLAGGDTDRVEGPATIAVTVFGECPVGRMVPRGGVTPGDQVYVTGHLGGAALGLALRLKNPAVAGWPIPDKAHAAARARYLRPEPRLGLRAALRAYASAAMDISDGLVKDLDRMCRLGAGGACGAMIQFDDLPVFEGLAESLETDRQAAMQLLTAGDDYEILATVPPDKAGAFEVLAVRGGASVTRIGEITRDTAVNVFDSHGIPLEFAIRGFDHFEGKP